MHALFSIFDMTLQIQIKSCIKFNIHFAVAIAYINGINTLFWLGQH